MSDQRSTPTEGSSRLKYARHVLHHVSLLDEQKPPYQVTAPEGVSAGRLPVVVLLHDTLDDSSAESFLEETFRQSAAWESAFGSRPPALLVQPFGRGNASWLGAAGADLFAMLDDLKDRFRLGAVSLIGMGAGATGALQLAAWFPHRFASVSAIGPWTDDRFDLPLGAEDWPVWERRQRLAVSPRRLASNYLGVPLQIVESASWGVRSGFPPHHITELVTVLQSLNVPHLLRTRSIDQPFAVDLDRQSIWQFAVDSPSPDFSDRNTHGRCFKSYVRRSAGRPHLQILEVADRDRPATILTSQSPPDAEIDTRNVASLLVDGSWASTLRIDGSYLALEPNTIYHCQRMELGENDAPADEPEDSWQVVEAGPQSSRQALRPNGPVLELFWDRIWLVVGTMAEADEATAIREAAEAWKQAWQTGVDAIQPGTGIRATHVNFEIVEDADFVAEEVQHRGNLVLFGSPRTNMALARWIEKLSISWPAGRSSDHFRVAGRTFDDPLDVAFVLSPRPRPPNIDVENAAEDGLVFTAACASAAGLAWIARTQVAYFPDYLVRRRRAVLDWGYFPESAR